MQPAQDTATPPALPQVPDPTYYSARELDSYPRPVAPLRLDYPSGAGRDGAPGRAQFSLYIDEHGVVNQVSVVETALPGNVEDELRAALAATRFIPARKDGRPVKSRILLSISFAAAGESKEQP
ncbi:MAG: energy transducer TonB [Betaproteobacteria bacterium]|nr:energy transducer TonB [Betaproteobacteria bacterium]